MIIVSACLAGVECRYNGLAYPIPEVIEMVKTCKALPLCPEILGGLPSPRHPSEQCQGRVICDDSTDVTEQFTRGARIAADIAALIGCKKAILKAKSPSCGCGKIYDGTFSHTVISGDGVFAKMLKEQGIDVCTEEDIILK